MKLIFYTVLTSILFCTHIHAQEVIRLKPSGSDMTLVVRKALEKITEKNIKIILEEGTYKFLPDFATEEYRYITNHNNGLKKIIFPLSGYESVEIEGNGAKLIFHGRSFPFLFDNCSSVKMSDVTIDWDVPFSFQGQVIAVNKEEGWRDIQPFRKGFSWNVTQGRLYFPNIDGFNYTSLGSTLPFNPETKDVWHGAFDNYSHPERVEKLEGGILRFYEKLNYYPEVGSILHSKGPMGENRYAPAIQVISSKNILFDNVVIHHALGMGFLFERSETATIRNCGIYVPEGSDRVVSILADATHFCNCKGDIIIEDCRFENMLDDGTNVHGTYVEVTEKIDDHTLMYKFGHFQQTGFEFAGAGDEIWFIHQPSSSRQETNVVESVSLINSEYATLRFKNKLPVKLQIGDLLENKTWNPTFTMRGCTIQLHRARNIVLKTPLKIVIENNYLSSMMASILFRGESFFWFESGAVEDVIIRNNEFNYCVYGGNDQAVLFITPRLGKTFDDTETYDRNIRFENNIINTFGSRIVWANNVDGLSIKDNIIRETKSHPKIHPEAPVFEFSNCKNIELTGNSYDGTAKQVIKADELSRKNIIKKGNKGIE